jgi:amino acid permease
MSSEKFDTDHISFNNRSIEKGPSEHEHVVPAEDRFHFDKSDLDRVQRRLKQRHVQMFVVFFI